MSTLVLPCNIINALCSLGESLLVVMFEKIVE